MAGHCILQVYPESAVVNNERNKGVLAILWDAFHLKYSEM
jgi:hypothetical protein